VTRALLLALAAIAVGVSAGAGGTVKIAAHRGGALLWPENSLLAYRNAIALGADLLETDIHLTADERGGPTWRRSASVRPTAPRRPSRSPR
jgi:hypothetical protein